MCRVSSKHRRELNWISGNGGGRFGNCGRPSDNVGTGLAPSSVLGLAPSSATDLEIVEDRANRRRDGACSVLCIRALPVLCIELDVSPVIEPYPLPAFQSDNVSVAAPKAYVSFTISDGDNLQYDQHRMAALWRDPVRGSIPIGWTISPSLVQTAPSLAAYYMSTASPNDELIAGPSGAGYMYPSDWPQAQLPSFLKLTGELMQTMKLSIIQVLDSGSSQAFVDPGLQTTYVDILAPFRG